MREFHAVMRDLLAGMRKSRPAESSIAAHLLDINDPHTGAPCLCKSPHACPSLAVNKRQCGGKGHDQEGCMRRQALGRCPPAAGGLHPLHGRL